MTSTQDAPEAADPDADHEMMMSAVVQDRYGHADVLRIDRIPRPLGGHHDVLVRVAAAGLDRGAWHAMTGLPSLGRLYSRPAHRRPWAANDPGRSDGAITHHLVRVWKHRTPPDTVRRTRP